MKSGTAVALRAFAFSAAVFGSGCGPLHEELAKKSDVLSGHALDERALKRLAQGDSIVLEGAVDGSRFPLTLTELAEHQFVIGGLTRPASLPIPRFYKAAAAAFESARPDLKIQYISADQNPRGFDGLLIMAMPRISEK